MQEWSGSAPDDHFYAQDCVVAHVDNGWDDVSCSKKQEQSKEGRNIRYQQRHKCLCEWPATLAPEFEGMTKEDWDQRYPSDAYLTRAVLAGFFGYFYIFGVLYFVGVSASSLLKKQLLVSDRAAQQVAAARLKRDVTESDVTDYDRNVEFVRLVRLAQTPNPLTAGEAELQ